MSIAACAAGFWQRYDIRQIEDLENAVLGAEFEVTQLAGPWVGGSLAFAARDGVIYSSGLIEGRVALRGPVSRDALTIGIGLRLGAGSRHWLNEVRDGDVGLFLPGAEHDAIYTPGSLYVAATLTPRRLEEEAAREGIPFPGTVLTKTGLHATPIASRELAWIRSCFTQIHANRDGEKRSWDALSETILRTVLVHYCRFPDSGDGRIEPEARARIVRQAVEYIRENLAQPLSMDVLVRETGTPRRSLYRAFLDILEDTPQGFVRRLRVSGLGADCGVAAAARGWGAGTDLGRMAARYQALFGESPGATLAARRERLRSGTWL